MEPIDLATAGIDMTFVGGEMVYEAGSSMCGIFRYLGKLREIFPKEVVKSIRATRGRRIIGLADGEKIYCSS